MKILKNNKEIIQPDSLVLGDCLEQMNYIDDNSIDLICCDLPYETTTIEWDIIIPIDKLWQQYKRILKPTGCCLLFGVNPFSAQLVVSNLKWYKQTLIWNKNKCGSTGLAKYRPQQVTEDILVFAPNTTTYNPQMEEGEPYYRKSKNENGYIGKSNNHGYGFKPITEISNDGARYPKNIINISRDFSAQQQVHPTQKPVPLLEYLIKTYSNENELVLDNCMGSGSTEIACLNTNRNFIGIEKNKEYFDIATKRINEIDQKKNKETRARNLFKNRGI